MTGRIRVVRTDCELECPHIDHQLRAMGIELVLLPENISEQELADETENADLLLMCYTPITALVISKASRLKGIVKYGVGIDAIDIAAANTRGIPVVNVPEYAEETVAEGAFALLIALTKKLTTIHATMQTEGWAWPTVKWMGSDIAGKTLGLVGVGHIGRSMARMAGAGFGAKILGYDPHVDQPAMQKLGITKQSDLAQMLSLCDFVSIHCVLNEQTHHLIGKQELACLRPSAILINVSRGAIVDEAALVDALQSQRLAGAGLDVYSQEPLSLTGHPMSSLYGMANVILMPHLAFYTKEAMQRLEQETLARCDEILQGKPVLVKSTDPRLTSQKSGVVIST